MLMASLCDYSDVYILIRGNIMVPNTRTVAVPNNRKQYLETIVHLLIA